MLEQVERRSYAELVRDRILAPLDMMDTDPAITHETRRRLVTGYRGLYDDRPWQPGHGRVEAPWLETNTADGCIASTAADLAAYLRMLMNGGAAGTTRILSHEGYRLMTTAYAGRHEKVDCGYGYGLNLERDEAGQRLMGHGGGMVGFYALMLANVDAGFGVVTMVNAGGSDQNAIARYALGVLGAAASDVALPEPPDVDDPVHVENAAEYAGRYRAGDGNGQALRIDAIGQNLLLLTGSEQVTLERRDEDAFLVPHANFDRLVLRFERDDDGRVVSVNHGERWWARDGASNPSPVSCPDEWRAYPGHYRCHNPWYTNFRVVMRNGSLSLVYPNGDDESLTPVSEATFRIGEEGSPEFVQFDTVVDGEAWRVNYSGGDYYRFFTR